jgi:hypothetical protein
MIGEPDAQKQGEWILPNHIFSRQVMSLLAICLYTNDPKQCELYAPNLPVILDPSYRFPTR